MLSRLTLIGASISANDSLKNSPRTEGCECVLFYLRAFYPPRLAISPTQCILLGTIIGKSGERETKEIMMMGDETGTVEKIYRENI